MKTANSETVRSKVGEVWATLPEALARSGLHGSAAAVFAALQHPWKWDSSGPRLGRDKRATLDSWGLTLPAILEQRRSSDGATKLLLDYGDDQIETVHMPRMLSHLRATVCLSSQVGCAMGCTFCATARLGLRRHLTAGEIMAQLLVVLHRLGPRHPSDLSVVFMGMGEPLNNLEAVLRAVEVMTHPKGLGLSPRRITISTAGIVTEIERLALAPSRPLLAVSLNATTDPLRAQLMPVTRRHPLASLAGALQRFPLRAGERILIEYLLLAGVNDSPDDASRLADFAAGFPSHVNLVFYNESDHCSFRRPTEEEMDSFARSVLARRPTVVTVRRSRGDDVKAGCGQLAQRAVVSH